MVTETSVPPGVLQFQAFQTEVVEDQALQTELLAVTEPGLFLEAVVSAGRKRGYTFDLVEVESAYETSRHEWMLRAAEA